MQLISVEPEHLPTIRLIAEHTWYGTYGNILSPKQIKYMLNQMYSIDSLTNQINVLNHQFYLLQHNDDYVAFISCSSNYDNQHLTKIHKIYVLPQCQGMGLGKVLINKATDVAQLCNDNGLLLNVNRYNKALQFYLHLGFVIVKEENIDIGEGFLMEDYVLRKDF